MISTERMRIPMLCTAVAVACSAQAQLTLNSGLTPEQLVQNVLMGGGIQATNITFNGGSGTVLQAQMASFNGTNTFLGMNAGVLMATGGTDNALGPNNSEGSSTIGGDYDATDPDLATLSGFELHDAAVLEFDFVPNGDSLHFDYIFASEEYPEYACSEYNDVFGFFLSGPGINGPFTNNAINIALIPGTNVPVAINTLNGGVAGDNGDPSYCAAADPNWDTHTAFYVNNGDGLTAPYDTDPRYVQYDGYTVNLTARARVVCGATYHIKICIADAGDDVLDSGVFLEAGSFSSTGLPPIVAATVTGDGIIAEGCSGSYFVVHRPDGVDSTLVIPFLLTGQATPGDDYAAFASPIVLPEGQDSVAFDVQPVADALAEGQETVILTAYTMNDCGDTVFASTQLIIADYQPMQITTTNPVQLHCDQDSVQLLATASGGYGPRTMRWDGVVSNDGTLWVPGRQGGTYTVSATDLCPRTVSTAVVVESGCEVIIPNVISPNGDGKNDYFVIKGIDGTQNHVSIRNRWGQEVFSANNYRNTWSARDLPDGTYFYVVQVENEHYTGSLTILNNK